MTLDSLSFDILQSVSILNKSPAVFFASFQSFTDMEQVHLCLCVTISIFHRHEASTPISLRHHFNLSQTWCKYIYVFVAFICMYPLSHPLPCALKYSALRQCDTFSQVTCKFSCLLVIFRELTSNSA